MRLLLAIETALGSGEARARIQGGFEPFPSEAFADPLDGGTADLQRLDNLEIRPAAAFGASVRFEQDARPSQGACGGLAAGNQGLESGALFLGEGDEVLLLHG